MARGDLDLKATLARLDETLGADVHGTLRKGASTSTLKKLEKVVGDLPADAATLFQWHDGQQGFASLGPTN